MNTTVAICAYATKRWPLLTGAVTSVVAQLAEGDDVLLVIDHNDELLARAARQFGADTRVRNYGVARARGDLVAFLDDDAVAEPGWLAGVRSAFDDPDVWAVGTAAVPAWANGARPSWFPDEYDWVVGCTYRGLPTEVGEVRNVNGAAMAFRREAFVRVGGFSAVVGRTGAAYTGCEETEMCIRLRQRVAGARIVYLPDVQVRHHVPRERMMVRHFLRRCYGEGRSKARVAHLVGTTDGLSSERSYVRSTLPRGVAREVRRGLRGVAGGWAAAALIVVGLGVTGTGYVLGRLGRRATIAAPAEVVAVAGG